MLHIDQWLKLKKPNASLTPVQKSKTLAEIFHDDPKNLGLRGDPHLWTEIKNLLKHRPYPDTEDELLALLEQTYQQITGKPLRELSFESSVFVKKFDQGGMSSGYVSPEFWIKTGIPLLLERYNETK